MQPDSRSFKQYFFITLKGMAMGAADVVPGVSGGTIAFISGIYEELIDTINAINLKAITVLRKEGVKAAWVHINGSFLLALLLGIGISIASLAKLITYLLEAHPVLIWSFFFGLIVASVFFIGKQIKKWNTAAFAAVVIGTAIAWYVTILPPLSTNADYWFIFVAAAIAICAMILPGISGSFILLILGAYEIVLGAIKDLKLAIIGVFVCGAAVGLLSFSRLLKWMFDQYHTITIAFLCGFLIGSLNKVWPWKKPLETKMVGDHEKVLTEENLSPLTYGEIPGNDSQLILAVVMALLGLSIIFVLEKLGKNKPNEV